MSWGPKGLVKLAGLSVGTLILVMGACHAQSPTVLDEITVSGSPSAAVPATAVLGNLPPPYAGGQVASGGQLGLLGNRSILDTPFSQTSYTLQTIENQQAQTLIDVFENDASILPVYGRYTTLSATSFRGFTSATAGSDDYSLNGLFGIVPRFSPALYNIERVEVLKGPSALLNGTPPSGAVGGTANLVTKRAGDVPLAQLTTSYASRSQLGAHIDLGRRFGVNKEFGIRFNGVYRNGGIPIKHQQAEQSSAALNLDYRGERVRLSADLGHQADNVPNNSPLRFSDYVPTAPNASRLYSPPWAVAKEKSNWGMIQGEADLAEGLTVYGAIGTQKVNENTVVVSPTVTGLNGDYRMASQRLRGFSDVVSGQFGIRSELMTGPVKHAINVNYSQIQHTIGSLSTPTVNTFSNIYNPVFAPAPYLSPVPRDPNKTFNAGLSSVGVADTISILGDRVQFTAGVRRQQIDSTGFIEATGVQSGPSYDEMAWSPAYALVIKPWENVSLYANYIEALERGLRVGPTFANANEIFPPYQSKQYEAGAKVDWGRVMTTVSVFEITRPSTMLVPGTPLPTLTQNGEQVNRGVELGAFGELTEGVRILGSAAFIDGRLTNTQGGALDGARAEGVPAVRLVAGGEWDLPFVKGLTLNGRLTWTDNQVVSATVAQTLEIPAWTRVDIGARYTFGSPWNSQPIIVRLDVENLFNENYWASGRLSSASMGDPRTVRLSTTFKF